MRVTRRTLLAAGGAYASILPIARPAGAADFTYKFGLNFPATHPFAVRIAEATGEILQDSGGKLDIKVFPGGQLGNGSQLISQLRLGALELTLPPDADLASVVPTASITALPFIVSDHQQALNILTGRFGSYIHDAVAKVGLYQFPRSWDGDFLELQTAARPVSTPSDLRGLKVRTSPSPVEIAVFKACGAAPAQTAPSELYVSLQTHLVDATTLPLPFCEPFKVYELTKYFSYTNHAWVNFTLLMNLDAWRRLPSDLQNVVARNFEIARNLANEDVVKGDSAAEGRLKEHGMVFNNADRQAFLSAVRQAGLFAQWKASYPPEA